MLVYFFPDQFGGARLHLLHWTKELLEAARIFTWVLPWHTGGWSYRGGEGENVCWCTGKWIQTYGKVWWKVNQIVLSSAGHKLQIVNTNSFLIDWAWIYCKLGSVWETYELEILLENWSSTTKRGQTQLDSGKDPIRVASPFTLHARS